MAQEIARVARRLEEAKETKNLDLSKCELLRIPDAAYLMLKNCILEKCDLSHNKIKAITAKFCSKFPALIELQLEGNNFDSLPDEMRELRELRVLNISHNKLESLPPCLYDCPNLTTVIASFNNINDVDIEALKKMSSLKEINLQDNPLNESTQQIMKDIDTFAVLVGESDPVGKELEELE